MDSETIAVLLSISAFFLAAFGPLTTGVIQLRKAEKEREDEKRRERIVSLSKRMDELIECLGTINAESILADPNWRGRGNAEGRAEGIIYSIIDERAKEIYADETKSTQKKTVEGIALLGVMIDELLGE